MKHWLSTHLRCSTRMPRAHRTLVQRYAHAYWQ